MNGKSENFMKFEFGLVDIDIIYEIEGILSAVFKENAPSVEVLKRKHLKKSLKSFYVVARDELGEVVGCRCVLVSKVDGLNIFQNCETSVLPLWRRRGLFLKMTTLASSKINKYYGKGVFINYPNKSSLPGYLKLGFRHLIFHKGIVFPRFKDIFDLRFILTPTPMEGFTLKRSKKKGLFLFDVVDYESISGLRKLSLKLLFRGKLLILVSPSREGILRLTTVNCVYSLADPNFIRTKFRPFWIDTVSYG